MRPAVLATLLILTCCSSTREARLNAADGTSRNGTSTPLFRFSGNKHPIGAVPAIYSSNGRQYAAFASGGYADPTVSSREALEYVVGLNWYLNDNVKVMADYARTKFVWGAKLGHNRQDESAFLTRVQVSF